MQGVVSILDDEHNELVEVLWKELEDYFGLKYACVAYPHFTYQIVDHYDTELVADALREVAALAQPFQVTTSGLGIFTGPRPVLYIRVVRDDLLSRFHSALWRRISPYGHDIHTFHYAPQNWIPHITLAVEDLTHDNLPDVIRLLSPRAFNWTMTINNLCLVLNAQGSRDEWLTFPFGRG
jgi:2'-5' RNA ligase